MILTDGQTDDKEDPINVTFLSFEVRHSKNHLMIYSFVLFKISIIYLIKYFILHILDWSSKRRIESLRTRFFLLTRIYQFEERSVKLKQNMQRISNVSSACHRLKWVVLCFFVSFLYLGMFTLPILVY